MKDWLTERGAGQGVGGVSVQQALVVGQVALAMALLVTAGLLVESFRQLRTVDPGFRAGAGDHGQGCSARVAAIPMRRLASRFVDRLLDDHAGTSPA